jgi:hypothetical protein
VLAIALQFLCKLSSMDIKKQEKKKKDKELLLQKHGGILWAYKYTFSRNRQSLLLGTICPYWSIQ